MTVSSEPTGNPSANSGESAPNSNDLPAAVSSQDLPDVGSGAIQNTEQSVDEGLPEWEPLTPELVEDEAIRGDFVIRWAVVGLALLFGFSQISDTRTLVHIRSGEYMATHGFLPPSKDVFSTLAADRRWVNLSWMFDLLAAGVHSVGGGIGLSIVQGLLVGIAFLLLANSQRSGIRTWWGSVCAVLALLTSWPLFTMHAELMTLVGMAATLYIVVQSEEASTPKSLWLLVPLNWLWFQLDNRAFFGCLLLACLLVGESLRRGIASTDTTSKERRLVGWKVLGLSYTISVIHPFLWETWLSPLRLYGVDYPALRQIFPRPSVTELPFYSIAHPTFWSMIDHCSIAALILMVATAIVMLLNRERLHPGHVLAYLVFSGLGLLTTHELAISSFVNCVIAAVNGQIWYRERFGQVYSVDWRELLFSRGGRAITVLSFFALAWLVISGRIDGPGGKRTGIGFNENLLVQMNDYAGLKTGAYDDHPFHFSVRQGDLLIWGGQKSFVDNRVGLFSGSGNLDLIDQFNKTRWSLQLKRDNQPGSGDKSVWQSHFDKHKVTHIMPRLSGPYPPPDYSTFSDLLASSDWALTDVRPTTAIFYRTDSSDSDLKAYVEKNRMNFIARAFRGSFQPADLTREFAKPATTYDNIFSLRRPRLPAGIQAAQHYVSLAGSGGNIPVTMRAACAYLAIRNATAGLKEDPHVADGYRVLGQAYSLLDRVEVGVMSEAQSNWGHMMRYYQAVAAVRQALALNPDDLGAYYILLPLYQKAQRPEFALETLREIKRLSPYSPNLSAAAKRERDQLIDLELNLNETLSKISEFTAQLEQQAAKQETPIDKLQIAMAAAQNGGLRYAMKLLESDAPYLAQNPSAKLMLGNWYVEVGRVREAQELLADVEAVSTRGGGSGWQDAVTLSALTNSEYGRAKRIRNEQIRSSEEDLGPTNLGTLPFLTLNQYWISSDQYPMTHIASISQRFDTLFNENSLHRFEVALVQMEEGDVAAATQTLKQILALTPSSPLRPLVRFYLFCLTDEMIEMKGPPIESGEEFSPLDETTAAK